MSQFNKQKAFGQHFLSDPKVISEIVDHALNALTRNTGAALLEIGPGKGAITRPLLERLSIDVAFYVAERDRELIEYWKPESRIHQLLAGDFLDQPDETIAAIGPMVVVSNLPYSAGTAIVARLAERPTQISEMVLMFQAEVAKRLYAEASTPDRGSLSLFIQNYWKVERLIVVKPEAFKPPPKVMSEVVRLTRRESPLITLETDQQKAAFDDLLKQSFKHRRKMMRGNLAGTPWQKPFDESGLDPKLRAEALEWKDWIALWQKRFS